MRRSAASALALLSLALVAGCGASGDKATATTAPSTTAAETTTTETPSDEVSVTEWADGFCETFGDWLDGIKQAGDDAGSGLSGGDLEGAKEAIVGLFDSASSVTRTLLTSLSEGGSPDIAKGDQFVEDLMGKFEDFDQAISAAKDGTNALDTADRAKFGQDVKALLATFDKVTAAVGDSFGELDSKYPSSELQTALSSCDSL